MLKKINRLTKNKEFEQVFQTGRSSYNKLLGMKITPNNLGVNRFGILISSKISKKAVERNKIKRRIRSVLAKQQAEFLRTGFDCVLITLKDILNKTQVEIEGAIVWHLRKLKLTSYAASRKT